MKLHKGIYRHFKGKLYEIIDFVTHSETEEELVLYRSLNGKVDLWVRPIAMFHEVVEINGEKLPRFEFIRRSNE
tara:strand:- start:374 stop:595 length:222 start_codon:yes stop_codon:yes gene_type:complete